jgi:hypothetical protein
VVGGPLRKVNETRFQRDSQGRVTHGLFEKALPPRQVQLALRLSF